MLGGMRMSMIARSGSSSRTRAIRTAPLAACPTTSKPARSSRLANPSRSKTSSSASTTRVAPSVTRGLLTYPSITATWNVSRGTRTYRERVSLRCLIVDDSASFAQAARRLLELDGIRVVGVASNGDEAVAHAQRLRPDFALVDLDLGGESGLDVVERLAAAEPHAV